MNKRLLLAVVALGVLTMLGAQSALAASSKRHRSSQSSQGGYSDLDVPQSNQSGASPTAVSPIVPPQFQHEDTLEMPPQREQQSSREVPSQREQTATTAAKISVTATDRSGRWVPDLGKSDVAVFEDDQIRQVLGVQRDVNTPVSIGIVIDTTGSMESKIGAAKAALSHFIETMNPNDEAFLIAFSTRSFLLQDFTTDRGQLRHTLGILHADGRTALYDAVINGLRKVQQGRWRKRALIVITDGIDNSSSASLNDAIDAARRAGVLVYTVGIGEPGATGSPRVGFSPFGGIRIAMSDPDDERVDDRTLARLADETGASTFIVQPRAANMGALDSHFQQVSDELRSQYTVAFGATGDPSTPHRIRVESRRDNVMVRGPKWLGHSGRAGMEGSEAAAD